MSFNNQNRNNSSNPGHVLASAVDAEIAKFRQLQQDLGQQRQDLSTVMQQETENEMVLMELQVVTTEGSSSSKVYKQLGPVLLAQDVGDAKHTVEKRLEFIRSEKTRLERRVADTEQAGNQLAARIQQMQAALQQSTADAVRAIAAQHGGGTTSAE